MKRFRPFLIGAGLGILGLGVIPLTGLPTHRAGVEAPPAGWFHWITARQSVTLRSFTTTTPEDFDDPARALRAAGHYELVCAVCHGSPDAPPERFADDLTPRPPRLDPESERWRPNARVFHTVKYGIRGTAMPAWPKSLREDEIWDMTAFLRTLPRLSAEEYREMAGMPGDCAHCHGADGQGRDGIPRLDTLSPDYIAATLRAFRDGSRASGTMIAVTRGMTEDEVESWALAYGNRATPSPAAGEGAAAEIARAGLPDRDIPACLTCHEGGDPAIHPPLAGQEEHYLRQQLILFRDAGEDRGGPRAEIMAEVARWLKDEEIDALAEWFAAQEVRAADP